MFRKRDLPGIGELVICRISRINPNSAFAFLVEYGVEGMVHISEIDYGWIRDIRKHVKIGQESVALVLSSERGHISLSLKRVDAKKQKIRMKEYMLDQKAERLLGIIAKDIKKSTERTFEEVVYPFQDNFGSIFSGFRQALKNPDSLRDKIPAEWIEPIIKMAEKNIKQKEFTLKARLILKSYKPNGINIIKDVLKEAAKMQLEIKYIAAPEYLISYKTIHAKKGEAEFAEKIEMLSKNASGCICEIGKIQKA